LLGFVRENVILDCFLGVKDTVGLLEDHQPVDFVINFVRVRLGSFFIEVLESPIFLVLPININCFQQGIG
jgi:hypothetical protein